MNIKSGHLCISALDSAHVETEMFSNNSASQFEIVFVRTYDVVHSFCSF